MKCIMVRKLSLILLAFGLLSLRSSSEAYYNLGANVRGAVDVDAVGVSSGCDIIQTNAVSGAGTSLANSFVGNTVAGDTIVVTVSWVVGAATRTLSSVTDTQGNTYTLVAGTYATQANTTHYKQIATQLAYATGIVGGADTVIATLSGAPTVVWSSIYEISPSTLDQVNSATGDSTTVSAGSITTTSNGECAFSQAALDAPTGQIIPNASHGWSSDYVTSSGNGATTFGYEVQASAGALAGDSVPSLGGAFYWSASMASFKSTGTESMGGSSAPHGTSLSWNHTCSGLNRLLVVQATLGGYGYTVPATLSATYNGVAMTALPMYPSGGMDLGGLQLFYLINPPTGTHTVQVSSTGGPGDIEANSVSFKNVNQSTPFQNVSVNLGLGSTASNTIQTTPGDMVLDSLSNGSPILSPNSGQMAQWITDLNGNTGAGSGGQSTLRGGGAMNVGWSTETDDWAEMDLDIVSANNNAAPPKPAKLAISNTSATFNYGQCTPLLIQTQTAAGVPTSVRSATTLNLNGTGMTFYSDSLCTTSITSTSLSANFTTALVYFEATQSGQNISVSAAGYSTVTQTETLNSGFGNGWYPVQSTYTEAFGSTTALTYSFNQATRAGDLIVAWCDTYNTGTLSMSDNAGNTYHLSPIGTLVSGVYTEQIFYVTGSLAGATSYTISSTVASPNLWCLVSEIADTTGPGPTLDTTNGTGTTNAAEVRQTGTTAGANQTVPTSMTATTAAAGDLIFVAATTQDDDFTFNAPFTAYLGWSNYLAAYSPSGTSQAVSIKEANNGKNWMVHAISFKP